MESNTTYSSPFGSISTPWPSGSPCPNSTPKVTLVETRKMHHSGDQTHLLSTLKLHTYLHQLAFIHQLATPQFRHELTLALGYTLRSKPCQRPRRMRIEASVFNCKSRTRCGKYTAYLASRISSAKETQSTSHTQHRNAAA